MGLDKTSKINFRTIKRKYNTNYKPIDLEVESQKDFYDITKQQWNSGLSAYSALDRGLNNRTTPSVPLLWKDISAINIGDRISANREVYKLENVLDEVNAMTRSNKNLHTEADLTVFQRVIQNRKITKVTFMREYNKQMNNLAEPHFNIVAELSDELIRLPSKRN
ncbi:MAG: hypothetical protein ACRC42_05095 [Mycoplasma sp.]